MIPVSEALERLFALVAPLDTELVPLTHAGGRVLAADVVATHVQPPFDAAAMDGYAVRRADLVRGARLRLIGEAPAGTLFPGAVGPGEAVRIFTGGAMPDGADSVLIQENTDPAPNGIEVSAEPGPNAHVRPAGGDFDVGDRIVAPRRLTPADIALAAAMNAPQITVRRRPIVALVASGDELVPPGTALEPGKIVASNALGLKALFESIGAEVRLLPIARDTVESLTSVLRMADGADLIVTIGGASVGDRDLIAPVARGLGLDLAFHRVAMRPGKPLLAGRLGGATLVGLPGNPVSAMVCGLIFVCPMLRAMLGLAAEPAPRRAVPLTEDLAANGPREHYMRAVFQDDGVAPFAKQDSSLLSILSRADALIVRPPNDPPRAVGQTVDTIAMNVTG